METLRLKIFPAIIIMLIVFAAIFSGCSGGEDAPADSLWEPINQGYFLDSAVEGLKYETPTHSGETNKDGIFFYGDGETISFYIGGILIGKAKAKDIITPVDLVKGAVDETNREVINIARFLQSLDMDLMPENGISIPHKIHEIAESMSMDFDLDQLEFENNVNLKIFMDEINKSEIFDGIEMELLPASGCIKHLKDTIESLQNHDSDSTGNDNNGSDDNGQDQDSGSNENDNGSDAGTGGSTGGG